MAPPPRKAGALPQGPELYQFLVDSVTDYAIFALDADGNVVTWNRGAQKLKGYEADEIIGRHFSSFYLPEQQQSAWPMRELARAAEDGQFEDEGWRVRKDGSRFWANVVITALKRDGELQGFAKVTRDLTRRRQMEESERAARLAAEKANRMKDEFLATVSHELRTPLNVMTGTIWRMRSGKESDPAALGRLIDTLDRNVRLQTRLVEDLLDVSRMVTGKLQLDIAPVELGPVIETSLEVVDAAAKAKGLNISTDLAPTGPILGDPQRLQQIFWNLLSNAVKFTPSSGEIQIVQRREGLDVVVAIRDTGRGIARDFLPHMFDRFSQAEESRTRSYGGLGLGLSIVKHLVEAHGGQISAESEGEHKGTTFRVSFPVPTLTIPADALEPALRAEELPSLRDVKVLVVDDQPEARETVTAVLSYAGADVRVAGSVTEALALLSSFHPNVLLADIAMPGADGFELIDRVRHEMPPDLRHIPAAALTAFSGIDSRLRILAAGFHMHLPKPIDPHELTESVALLARKLGGPSRVVVESA